MLNFDESRVRQEHENGIALIPAVEKVVDDICAEGYSSIIFMGIGGTYLYAGIIDAYCKANGLYLTALFGKCSRFPL